MKYIYVVACLLLILISVNASAGDATADNPLSQEARELSKSCNLEARNFLVSGNLASVEELCTRAVSVIEKSRADREYMINPMMNLALSYTLAGQFDKATQLYNRARDIREKLYGADSKRLKEIDDMIKRQEEIQKQHRRQ